MVKYQNVPCPKRCTTSLDLFIDGNYVDDAIHCNGDVVESEEYFFAGFPEITSDSENICRAFTFGKMETTGETRRRYHPLHLSCKLKNNE